jgi:hypothetical protein
MSLLHLLRTSGIVRISMDTLLWTALRSGHVLVGQLVAFCSYTPANTVWVIFSGGLQGNRIKKLLAEEFAFVWRMWLLSSTQHSQDVLCRAPQHLSPPGTQIYAMQSFFRHMVISWTWLWSFAAQYQQP